MLAALVQARRQPRHFGLGKTRCRYRAVEARLAFRQRAGLVDDQRVDLAEVLDCRGVAEHHALRGRLARRDHDRHRRHQAQCARASDDEHCHGVDQAVDPARLRPEPPHTTKVSNAMLTTVTTK